MSIIVNKGNPNETFDPELEEKTTEATLDRPAKPDWRERLIINLREVLGTVWRELDDNDVNQYVIGRSPTLDAITTAVDTAKTDPANTQEEIAKRLIDLLLREVKKTANENATEMTHKLTEEETAKALAITDLYNDYCHRKGNTLSLRIRGKNVDGLVFVEDHGVWGDQSLVYEKNIATVLYRMTLVKSVEGECERFE